MSSIGVYRQQPTGYKALVLGSFPITNLIHWNEDLIMLLSKADIAIGKLNSIDQLVPDVDFFILMYVKKEATLSSQIEGTQATLIDLVQAEAKLSDENSPSDVKEIINYISAMNYGMNRLKEFPFSLRLIREIHSELLKGVRGKHATPGEFRKSQNWIGGPTIDTASFVPPTPNDMKNSLYDLEKFMHDKLIKWPILIKAGLIHAQFETIHPFLDGNGRTGRLLITFYLYKEGLLRRPLLYLSEYFKKFRSDYYVKLNSYRFNDGIEEWLKFFLEGIRYVSEEAVLTAQKITILREKNIKEVASFGRNADTALILLNYLFSHPIIDAKGVAKATGLASKTTVQELIDKFIRANILLEMTGKVRNRRYIYKDYIALFS